MDTKNVLTLAILTIALTAGCGGAGSVAPDVSTFHPSSQMATYNGSYYNASNQVLGAAVIQLTGTALSGTLTPTGPYTTAMLSGTVQANGNLLPNGNGASIGAVVVSGTQITITGIPDYFNNFGVMHVIATE